MIRPTSSRSRWPSSLALLLWAWSGPLARAQTLPPPFRDHPSVARPAAAGSPPALPTVPEAPPRPAEGPGAVTEFVEGLSTYDATFEVLVGQGRVLTVKEDLTAGRAAALIAVGDPSVIEFSVVNARQIRIIGQRIGVTDLALTTADGRTYNFEIRVVADLALLTGRLKLLFPDARLRLVQVRDHVVVEGQARDPVQVGQILQMIEAYLESIRSDETRKVRGGQGGGAPSVPPGTEPPGEVPPAPGPAEPGAGPSPPGEPEAGRAAPETGPRVEAEAAIPPTRVINLIRVPGSQQVLLKVRVAELNRSALRQIGANFLGVDPATGAIVGTQIAAPVGATGVISGSSGAGPRLVGSAQASVSPATTVFGIFQDANFEFTLSALRRNSMLRVLAEPNLVALSGHEASFLAGGEFPVPVPQAGSAGAAPTITVQFREFGVRLAFLPLVLDDEVIRLSVAPEVSAIDFAVATTLVAGGSPVPGLTTRRAQTTVELRQGQTLAIAGLLQLSLDGSTTRIPGLGDLPILGPFFSNTTSNRVEKELVVLVTPYLVEPMARNQVPPVPGDEVNGPNDLEFYFLNRIEGRTGKDFRATTAWDDPFHLVRRVQLERKYVSGSSGFSK
jgi:pilus assembly protein CpaC